MVNLKNESVDSEISHEIRREQGQFRAFKNNDTFLVHGQSNDAKCFDSAP